MAVLEKIRVKFGVLITVIIALALLSFIIDPNTLQSVSQSMSSKNNVGKIAGKTISYQEFQQEADIYTNIYEILTGSSAKTEEQQKSIREQAWQSLLDKYMFSRVVKNAGIYVCEDELVDLTTGKNISPVIINDPVFFDENGVFSTRKVIELAASAEEGTPAKAYWDYIQRTIYSNAIYTKYSSLYSAGNIVNALQARAEVEENNTTSDIEFVSVPVRYSNDSTITVSASEIKKYYKNHKEEYKTKETRTLDYVVFEVVPSEEDVLAANNALLKVYDEFANTDNMKTFLARNSDRQLSNLYYGKGELAAINSDIDDFVFAKGGKGVSPVIEKENVFYAVKVVDTKLLPDSIYVRYAQVDGTVSALTDSIRTELNAMEPMGMTQTYIIPGFEVLFDQPAGTVKFINTQYGKFAAQLVKKSGLKEKKQVAILEKAAVASKETYNNYWSQANTLATKAAGKYDEFISAAGELGLLARSTGAITEAKDSYGDVKNAKEVTRWAFDNKAGKASGIISVGNDAFFVVGIKEAHKEGYTTVAENAVAIKDNLYFKKLVEKAAATTAEKIKGLDNMEAIANALNTSVNKKEAISFAAFSAQGLDPQVIGAVAAAEEGKICGPIAGNSSVYVFKVTGREVGSFFTESDAKARHAQISGYSTQMLYPILVDKYVYDNRARFF